jgi:hypothetical protein
MPTLQSLQLRLVEAKEGVFNRLGNIFMCENWEAQDYVPRNSSVPFHTICIESASQILLTGHFSHEVG